MKKTILSIFFCISLISFSDFLKDMQKIDLLLQQGKYQEAFDNGNKLLNENISNSEKESLKALLEDIKEKIEATNNVTVSNNTGVVYTTEEGLASASLGTISLAGDQINDRNYFSNLESLEKEAIKGNDEENINKLMQVYIKSSLFEKAMKLGLKSKDLRNIYLSALTARLTGHYDISISQYNKILNQNPNHLESLLGIGLAYRGKKEYTAAVKFLNQYLNKGGTNPNVSKIINSLNK